MAKPPSTTDEPLPAGCPEVLDGYRLIRFLGRGRFGEVWLCRSEAMGDYRALKWIPALRAKRLEKEYQSLVHYRKAAAVLRSPHLVGIEHVGRCAHGLYYIMPLADGVEDLDPADPAWRPLTLAEKLHFQASAAAWFSSGEIIGLITPVLSGLQILTEVGLVHRDVKPENILFFGGQPCLGDISLLGSDGSILTRRGTPGYATPTWYQGGHPDMFGAAATLYTLLTGNPPDRMGRSSFLWPPQEEASLSPSDRTEWQRLHSIIRRATHEKVSERFLDFKAMANAIYHSVHEHHPSRRRSPSKSGPTDDSGLQSEIQPHLTPQQEADYRALATMAMEYVEQREYTLALAVVEELWSTYPYSRTQPAYSIVRAMALHGLGRIEEAKEELRKEVNLSPYIGMMSGVKDTWKKLGDLEGAETYLTRTMEKYHGLFI